MQKFTKYLATEAGEIVGPRGYPLKLFVKPNGYLHFSHSNGTGKPGQRTVHSYVWEFFNGPVPEGMVIDHINGNRLNNSIHNLQVITLKQNLRKGKMIKLDVDKVNEIKARGHEKQTSLAGEFGVHISTINDILKGRKWNA